MKRNAVAYFQGPLQHAVLGALRLKIGRRLKARIFGCMGLGIYKARRCKPPSPGVRTANELDGRILGHRVQRYPKADDVLAVYGVAGLVVVLGGALFGARLFDQNMFVVQIDFGRVHELRRQLLDG